MIKSVIAKVGVKSRYVEGKKGGEGRFTCTPTIKRPMRRVKGLEKREIAIPPRTPVMLLVFLFFTLINDKDVDLPAILPLEI
jgi:hypothetical protein